jgi:hypothetical protein
MKHTTIIIAVLTIASSVVFAHLLGADPKVDPTISLPDAYRQAMNTLGSATNGFHCSNAHFITEGEFWSFSFYNTNGTLKTVEVSTNGVHAFIGPRVVD